MISDWLDAGSQTFMIGLSASVFIIVAKLLVARYGDIMPNVVRDLVALV